MTASWREHRVPIIHGQRETRIHSGRSYQTISLGEIFEMTPGREPKDKALGILQSVYFGADARDFEVQREKGQFVTLCGDIDDGNHSLQRVADMVDAFTGDAVAWRVYSTSSATEENRKWRILIPLEAPLRFGEWEPTIKRFFDFAESHGIKMDNSLARSGQVVFLPNVPPIRRDRRGSPLFFQSECTEGGRGLRVTDPGLAEWRPMPPPSIGHPASATGHSVTAEVSTALRKIGRGTPKTVEHRFNDQHPLSELLPKYGYTRSPSDEQHWRSPHQASNSFATRVEIGDDGVEHWTSLSDSDKTAGIGRESANGNRHGDAFDLFIHFEHGGDRRAALASVVKADAESVSAAAEMGDTSAPFEHSGLTALCALRDADLAEWQRARKRLKEAGVGIGALERAMNSRTEAGGADDEEKRTTADRLIELARSKCKFVHDPRGEAYAVVQWSGARQIHRVQSRGFREYLSHAYYTETNRAPADQAFRTALDTLCGDAKYTGEEREVFTRVAKTADGYWLDLCNDAWECVQVTATGWAVVSGDAAPMFTRTASMRPLPTPARGGSLADLWPLLNIPPPDQLMVTAWLLESLRPDTPYVVLALSGEQGSAKSSTQRALRRLIDPNEADLRPAPKTVDDMFITAFNSHLVSLENVSHLSAAYQDALCQLATGGGYATRTLYTNAEETVLAVQKPSVVNGIGVVVTAQDLVDRSIQVTLPTIQLRELASDVERRFQESQPALLGALLDLFSEVLGLLPRVAVTRDRLPRMADFAQLGEAVFQAHGELAGAFLRRYAEMRRGSIHATIDASPVGAALLEFLERTPTGYCGPLRVLLGALDSSRGVGSGWPRSPKGLGDALRRLAPALRQIGIQCHALPKTGGEIHWHIFRDPGQPEQSPASPGSPAAPPSAIVGAQWVGHAGLPGHRLNGDAPSSEARASRA
jgi:hypothetical protein